MCLSISGRVHRKSITEDASRAGKVEAKGPGLFVVLSFNFVLVTFKYVGVKVIFNCLNLIDEF